MKILWILGIGCFYVHLQWDENGEGKNVFVPHSFEVFKSSEDAVGFAKAINGKEKTDFGLYRIELSTPTWFEIKKVEPEIIFKK